MKSLLFVLALLGLFSFVLCQDALSSPAELAFSMAELSSTVQVEAENLNALSTADINERDAFNSEREDVNENESDASEEGIQDADVFLQQRDTAFVSVDAAATVANCSNSSHQTFSTNPIVAVVDGKQITKTEFEGAKHNISIPKLVDPQPVNGVKAPGKMTPGFHCSHRLDCGSCLRLSSCLWNEKTSQCHSVLTVGALPRRLQWDFIATCDPRASPLQKRIDRRDRGQMKEADIFLTRRRRASNQLNPVQGASLMEISSTTRSTAHIESENQDENEHLHELTLGNSGVKLLLDDTPSLPVEAEAHMDVEDQQDSLAETQSQFYPENRVDEPKFEAQEVSNLKAVQAAQQAAAEPQPQPQIEELQAMQRIRQITVQAREHQYQQTMAQAHAIVQVANLQRQQKKQNKLKLRIQNARDSLPVARSHLQTASAASADASAAAQSTATAVSDFTVTSSGAPRHGGVDTWLLPTDRAVENAPLGLPIGSLTSDTQVVVEAYKYINRTISEGEQVQVLYGYGFVAGKVLQFGGWSGMNSCGWFPLQRVSDSLTLRAHLVKQVPRHPRRCPPGSDDLRAGLLAVNKHVDLQSALLPSPQGIPKIAAAIVNDTCIAWRNYDPVLQQGINPAPAIERGTATNPKSIGKSVFGAVPTIDGLSIKKSVEGFGVRYVTKDGKMAVVNYPFLDPIRGAGNKFYFVDVKCVSFDLGAIAMLQQATQAKF